MVAFANAHIAAHWERTHAWAADSAEDQEIQDDKFRSLVYDYYEVVQQKKKDSIDWRMQQIVSEQASIFALGIWKNKVTDLATGTVIVEDCRSRDGPPQSELHARWEQSRSNLTYSVQEIYAAKVDEITSPALM